MNPLMVEPHEFLPEHLAFLEQYRRSVHLISSYNHELIMGLKDINSRYLVTNGAHATAIGIKNAIDMIGLSDGDMPCEDTSSFKDQYALEDKQALQNGDLTYTYLKIHNYADGFKARLIKKSSLYHKETNSILGIVFSGYEINFSNLFTLIPNYANLMKKAAALKQISQISAPQKFMINGASLTIYEYEICYLLAVGWSYREIADFMNIRNLGKTNRTADTIKKVKDNICRKLGESGHLSHLKQILIKYNIHLNPPHSILLTFSGCIKIATTTT